jgi:hypothetical protein
MAAASTRSRPLTGDRILVLPRPAQLAITGAADQPDRRGRTRSPNDNQAAPIGGSRA